MVVQNSIKSFPIPNTIQTTFINVIDSIPLSNSEMCFIPSLTSKYIPSINLAEFLKYILSSDIIESKNMEIDEILVITLIYLQRFLNNSPILTEFNAHRTLVICLRMAIKFYDDEAIDNMSWSQFLGISIKDLNLMEIDFLNALDFNLIVTREHFISAHKLLI